jgi:hypothetical protein
MGSSNRITPDMTILDIVARWEPTQAVFSSYDAQAGECICCNALFESVQAVATRYGLDLERLLRELTVAAGAPVDKTAG